MLELVVELLAEFVLQLFGEVLAELGLRSLAAPFQRRANPWLAALGYTLFGALMGGLSLLVFPQHFIEPGVGRLANLLLTPLAVGGCMAALGAWRARRGEPLLRIDRFLFGWAFAMALALTRQLFAG